MIDSASLLAVLPELILTAGGLILLMVAAFGGDGTARIVNALSVLTLIVAASVIAFGWFLAQGNNVYRFHKAVYWVIETVWPTRTKGTMFMEGSGATAPSDEYDFYK